MEQDNNNKQHICKKFNVHMKVDSDGVQTRCKDCSCSKQNNCNLSE